MQKNYSLALVAITALCLVRVNGLAHGQVPVRPSTVPPAGGYPHRTIREVPPAAPGPSSGVAVPGLPTVPGGMPALPTGIRTGAAPNLAAGVAPSVGGFDPRYQFWSPSTAVWDIQQQLDLAKPITIYGSRSAARAAASTNVPSTAIGDLPRHPGMEAGGMRPPALPDLQAAEPNAEGAEAPLPAPILPATPDALAAGLPFGPPKGGLDIPFEEFETFEEFNEWLRQKIAAPGDGMIGQGLPAGNALQPTGPGTARGQAGRRPQRPKYRPPIGYIGVGSSASVQLGNVNLGPNVATESARLVSELNNFLQSSRSPSERRSPPWEAGPPGAANQATLPPPPTSSLGRSSNRSTITPSAAYPSASAAGGFAPQVQPYQYWQNLGGYEPPTLRLEDWRP